MSGAELAKSTVVNCFQIDDTEIAIVDRSEGYERAPKLIRHSVLWQSFIRTPIAIRVYRELKTSGTVKAIKDEGAYIRVTWTDSVACRAGCQWLEENGFHTFEGNVSPRTRFLVESGIMPLTPRGMYLDIETDPRPGLANFKEMRVLIVGLIDAQTREKQVLVLDEDSDEAERKLLTRLMVILEQYDQVLAWNGDRFDFPLLTSRMRRFGVPGVPKRILWCDHMLVFKKQNQMAAKSGEEKQSYALNAVANSLLGRGKHEYSIKEMYDDWSAGGARRDKAIGYCMNDTELMPDIEGETGYLALFDTLCQSTGVFSDTRGLAPSRQVESFLLRLARERGHRFPTRFVDDEDEDARQFRGAWVKHPEQTGIFQNVHVIDFARLYPSVIQTLNLSPETKLGKREDFAELPEGCAVSACDIVFKQEPLGILPAAVTELLRLRKYWDDEKKKHAPGTPAWKSADRRSTAYKIAVNSFYGVVGSRGSMFFDVDVAESTTLTGRFMNEQTIAEAAKRAIATIYADTDSGFLTGCTVEECGEFVKWCNAELYPELVKAMGGARNKISLEHEKSLKRLVFAADARTGKPLSKKYAAKYLMFKGKAASDDSEPEIKGLEFKRGDSIRMARDLQAVMFDLLITKECNEPNRFEPMIFEWRSRIFDKPLVLEDVRISKGLSKDLDSYEPKPKKKPIELGRVIIEKIERKSLVVQALEGPCVMAKIFGGGKLRIPLADLHESMIDAEIKGADIGDELNLKINDYAGGSQHVQVARIIDANGTPMRMGDKVEFVITDGSTSPKTAVPVSQWDGVTIDRFEIWRMVWIPSKRLLMGAFPDHDWDRFDTKRPPKVRQSKKSAKPTLTIAVPRVEPTPAPEPKRIVVKKRILKGGPNGDEKAGGSAQGSDGGHEREDGAREVGGLPPERAGGDAEATGPRPRIWARKRLIGTA